MFYCRFLYNGTLRYGMVDVDRVIELTGSFLEASHAPTNSVHYLSEVQLVSPVDPKQVVAIGLNYRAHAKELKLALPPEPMMFMVSPSAIAAPGEAIRLADGEHRIDYEGELAVVIGKEAYKVKADEAFDYIFGYTCAIDVSDRDLQHRDGQYTRAKSFHTYKPIGPWIATNLDPNHLSLQLKQNNVVKQNTSTEDMIHHVDRIIETITDVMTLYPGDVVLTGTPSGVGPLSAGDKLELSIEGIGSLHQPVERA